MTNSVELQVISKILTSENTYEVEKLLSYDESYYAVFKEQIKFIQKHYAEFETVPDIFTFLAEFPDINLVQVAEKLDYLEEGLRKNKQQILFLETFNKLAELGTGDVDDAWEYLSAQCDKAARLDTSQPMNIIKDAKVRANQILQFNEQERIPTGFKEIDELMYGGLSTVEELLLIVARTNSGKAQPMWAKVLTPEGYKQMKDIKVGDIVIGKNNDNGKVIKIFPQGEKDYYRIHFNDGTFAECCDDHLWEVRDCNDRENNTCQVITAKEIRENLSKEYSVDLSEPIEFTEFNITLADRKNILNNLFKNGRCTKNKYFTYNEYYAEEFAELVRSLGMFAKIENDNNNFIVNFSDKEKYKLIESAEYMGKTECQCILLDNESHTYITNNFTVTHNSWVCTKIMESAQIHKFPVLYYSPEMRASFIGTRFDTWRNHFRNSDIFQGKYDEVYHEYIKNLSQEDTDAFVVEDSDMSEGKTTVKALENLVRKYRIKLLIIDGLSYLQEPGRNTTDTSIRYKNICDDLFRLSKTYQCAVVVSTQANRESRENKDEKGEPFPNIYNVAESDHPARIATQVFAIRQIFDRNILEIRLEKSRIAKNEKPTFSYVWDANVGSMELLTNNGEQAPTVQPSLVSSNLTPTAPVEITDEDFDDEDIEF